MEILNKTPIMGAPFPKMAVAIAVGILILSTVISIFNDAGFVIFVSGILLSVIVGGCESNRYYEANKYETGRYRYEVILDKDYPVSELYEKYNVIEQKGKIWVIEDKEGRNNEDNN